MAIKSYMIVVVIWLADQFISAELQLVNPGLLVLISVFGGFAIIVGLLGIVANIIPLDDC